MRRLFLLPFAALAGCGEPVQDDHFANTIDIERPEPAPVRVDSVPVRIGELGASFGACSAAGTTRHLAEGASLTVRSAPFEAAEQTAAIPAGARFFVCTRSHDQDWMGVVFHESGALDPSCGVSGPASRRQAYAGPCDSGWVSSALVKLVAG